MVSLSEEAKIELRELGLSEDFVGDADRRAKRGVPKIEPPADLLERMMERVGPKLKKVGFGDAYVEKDEIGPYCITEEDKSDFGKQKAVSKGEKKKDKGGIGPHLEKSIGPSLEKGFETKSEKKKGAEIGFSGGGTGN